MKINYLFFIRIIQADYELIFTSNLLLFDKKGNGRKVPICTALEITELLIEYSCYKKGRLPLLTLNSG